MAEYTCPSVAEASGSDDLVKAVTSFLSDNNVTPMGSLSLRICSIKEGCKKSTKVKLLLEAELGREPSNLQAKTLPAYRPSLGDIASAEDIDWSQYSRDLLSKNLNNDVSSESFNSVSASARDFDNADSTAGFSPSMDSWPSIEAAFDEQVFFRDLGVGPTLTSSFPRDIISSAPSLVSLPNTATSSAESPSSAASSPPRRTSTPKVHNKRVKQSYDSILRQDYMQYLEIEIPRWTSGGLWRPALYDAVAPGASLPFRDLERAYSIVCQLEVQMDDGAIRKRMALIQLNVEYIRACETPSHRTDASVGRGEVSLVIDNILQNMHEGWDRLAEFERATIRARFHNSKRYGKRWAALLDILGPGILFLCSTGLVRMVHNTKITFKMLQEISESASNRPEICGILGGINPLADALLNDRQLSPADANKALEGLKSTRLSLLSAP